MIKIEIEHLGEKRSASLETRAYKEMKGLKLNPVDEIVSALIKDIEDRC